MHLRICLVGLTLALSACKDAAPSTAPARADAGAARSSPPSLPFAALQLPASMLSVLERGAWDASTPKGFRIVALSFTADGCVARARRNPDLRAAALRCVRACLERAEGTRPTGSLEDQGLWRTHLNLLLGARDSLGGCNDPAAHAALARSLAQRSLAERTRHVPSYPDTRARWPADQTATLASLARFDAAHGTALAAEPVRQWRAWMEQHALDARLGLPWSEATGTSARAKRPRGCALAWQTRFLNEVAPDLARLWWQRFREHYLVDRLALVGFREWPPGEEGPADIDSGPIVLGIGAAATGLAIGAARVMGDDGLAARIEGTAAVVEAGAGANPALKEAGHTALADALRYHGASAGP